MPPVVQYVEFVLRMFVSAFKLMFSHIFKIKQQMETKRETDFHDALLILGDGGELVSAHISSKLHWLYFLQDSMEPVLEKPPGCPQSLLQILLFIWLTETQHYAFLNFVHGWRTTHLFPLERKRDIFYWHHFMPVGNCTKKFVPFYFDFNWNLSPKTITNINRKSSTHIHILLSWSGAKNCTSIQPFLIGLFINISFCFQISHGIQISLPKMCWISVKASGWHTHR